MLVLVDPARTSLHYIHILCTLEGVTRDLNHRFAHIATLQPSKRGRLVLDMLGRVQDKFVNPSELVVVVFVGQRENARSESRSRRLPFP